ncbi:hypothetical protein [Streptomyces sp. NPDC002054]|uniref:hypothetical protein n=1 Tax=Streptomyces sp. NPDC002054 TaxID=3154663 RepID=UPI003317EE87
MDGIGRLLPWAGTDEKPCYLVGDGAGFLSRYADKIELVQLGMAASLIEHAEDMLADRRATRDQLHFLAGRMNEALRDVHRIAVSRGDR